MKLRWAGWIVFGTLLAAAGYELALALRHSISPNGEGWILLVALVATLIGTVLVFREPGTAALFAPAAALFVIARLFTGDPYYEPTFRAYGDGGIVSPFWAFALLGLALVAGAATRFWRRTAPVESAAVLLSWPSQRSSWAPGTRHGRRPGSDRPPQTAPTPSRQLRAASATPPRCARGRRRGRASAGRAISPRRRHSRA